jgi:hypothetical protein
MMPPLRQSNTTQDRIGVVSVQLQGMQNLKFGVVVCGLLGLVGCFLPLQKGLSFFDTRYFDAASFYIIAAAYAAAMAMGVMGILQGMQRWMATIAIVAFAVVVLRMRAELIDLLKAGIGGKLMGVGAIAGLVFAILTTVKPEPAR